MALGSRARRSVFGLAVVLMGVVAVGAQQEPGDRGGAPNPLGQPLQTPSGAVRDDAMLRAPLLPEDRQYADLDGTRLKSLVMEVDAISLADKATGRVFWGRNVGTPGHDATQTWVENHFRRNGLQGIRRESFDLGPQWNPKSYDITFVSGGQTFKLESARPSRSDSTPPGGLELELVWVAGGSDADYLGRDVRGKAVLIHDIPLPGDIRHTVATEGAVQRALEKGAAAVGIVFGISDNFAIWQRTGGRPGFNLGYEDGLRLRERLGRGEKVMVRYRLESSEATGLKTAGVWGVLPGTTDEDIIVLAHMDGYFQAALDNGSGLAVLIGLVEHYAKVPQAQRRRSIRFYGSPGHHGGPGARSLHDNAARELAKTALVINLEHVAAVRSKYWGPHLRMTTAVSPMRWWVFGSHKLLDIVTASFRRFNVGVTADMDPGASGEMGSVARDTATMQVITSPEVKHTEQDTPEWVPAAGLEQISRAYARIIDEINKLERPEILPSGN